MKGVLAPAVALLAGVAIATAVPSIPQTLRSLAGLNQAAPASDGGGHADAHGEHGAEGRIAMTAEQVSAAGITVADAGPGVLAARAVVPAVLAANGDRLARVTARAPGIVADIRKRVGDPVTPGDVLATIESRDIADAKGDFLAASRTAQLTAATLARETRLWKQRVSPEQDYLQADAAAQEARIRLETATQRLAAMGLGEAEITDIPRQPPNMLRRLDVRASASGRLIARGVAPGAAVTAETELFTIADLGTVWVEMAIPPRDLPMVREGQTVTVSGDGNHVSKARIVTVNPVLDPETRSARAVAELANPDGAWRPGAFVTVTLTGDEQPVDLLVPREAVQEIEGRKSVFVRTDDGFEAREVALGREDSTAYEVIFGLDPGTSIAVGNVFALRAELQKSEAGHAH
jgi:cobalt-zinc-cadmium efflux system membrane fusion protein